MTARWVRAQLRRRSTVGALVALATCSAWFAWRPGAANGGAGAWHGAFVGAAVLGDIGLLVLAVVAGVAGSSIGSRGLAAYLGVAGARPAAISALATWCGAGLGLAAVVAATVGGMAGGVARAVIAGWSWWGGPAAATAPSLAVHAHVRTILAVVLVGALFGMFGSLVATERAAAGWAVAVVVPVLPEMSVVVGRWPVVAGGLSWTPLGAVRGVWFAEGGISLSGYESEVSVARSALVCAAWMLVLVGFARTQARRPVRLPVPARPPGHGGVGSADRFASLRTQALAASVVVMATLTFGAVAPPRLQDDLPWRWQRSWRAASHAGRASDQVVDRVVERARTSGIAGWQDWPEISVAMRSGPVDPRAADALTVLARASSVHVAEVKEMNGPGEVVVLASFVPPVRSGNLDLRVVAVRFELESGPDPRDGWHVVSVHGAVPVAADVVAPTELP